MDPTSPVPSLTPPALPDWGSRGQRVRAAEALEARIERATRNWMNEHGERNAVIARLQVTDGGLNGPRLDRYSGPEAL